MVTGLWGKKVGMTQLFVGDKVMPVTAIDGSNWVITGVKTVKRDGYAAVQIGCVKKRYQDTPVAASWMKDFKKYFTFIREVKLGNETQEFKIGKPADFLSILSEGDVVETTARTKGCGFAGVVRRHNFGGPPASHGHTMGNRTGSIGSFCATGKVIKGKKMPGHMGNKQKMTSGLTVVKVDPESQVVFVKGAVPGKAGSLVFVRKS